MPEGWRSLTVHNERRKNAEVESKAMTSAARAGIVPSAIVLAVESDAGWTAKSRFSVAVLSAIEGELPFHRYLKAGRRAAARGVAAGVIERSAQEWARTTFHPIWGYMLGMDNPRSVVDCMAAYNSRDLGRQVERERGSPIAVYADGEDRCWDDIPYWGLSSGKQGDFRLYATRVSANGLDDPRGCQIAALGAIQYAVEQAQLRAEGIRSAPRTLSSAAVDLGAERSAAAEAVWLFEREGSMPIESLAKRLGCRKRTLERELQAVGLTAGKLRLASMVIGATSQLHSGASLTQIAADQGFSDLSHMTRAFKTSCGMSPSALRGGRGEAGVKSGIARSAVRD